MTGENDQVDMTGSDQLLLSLALFMYPPGTADQICGFTHTNGGDIYTWKQVTHICANLQLTRKRDLKEVYDVFSASSIWKLDWFVTLLPTLGVSGQ